MKIFSSWHDPKNEKYAIYYSIMLLFIISIVTLLVNNIFEIGPLEGIMMFFEGFVALVMLSRHEKVSRSFTRHMSQMSSNLKNGYKSMTKINFKMKF
jgi:flagellar hook-associated protein FlgK